MIAFFTVIVFIFTGTKARSLQFSTYSQVLKFVVL